ncbi:MAG: AAA domain-containing protein [Bacteroidota bacterium]
MHAPLVRYLRDCFEEDHRRATLWNVFAKTIGPRYVVPEREDILTGDLTLLPLVGETAGDFQKATTLYRREKELLYASLFVVGSWPRTEQDRDDDTGGAFGRPVRICAPLLTYPATLQERPGGTFAAPDLSDPRLNEGLLRALDPSQEGEMPLSERLWGQLATEVLGPTGVYELAALLTEAVPTLDGSQAEAFPALLDAAALRARMPKHGLALLPASMLLLTPRGRGTRGVLSELDALATATQPAAPLRFLLTGQQAPAPRQSGDHLVPAILSRPQQTILDRAAERTASVVVGPPGTGKSFTIAALAAEHVLRGETVLVASKMDHAVDVVADKIERQLGMPGVAMRAGRRGYGKALKAYFRQLLSGMHTQDAPTERALHEQRRRLLRSHADIDKAEAGLAKRERQEAAWSRALADAPRSLRARWAAWRTGRTEPVWHLAERYEARLRRFVVEAQDYARQRNAYRLADVLKRRRLEIQLLDQALRARASGTQKKRFDSIRLDTLLAAFPVWLVALGDLAETLPMERELFDLAIIDEASQCDLASVLPLFQRAKRVVVVGDPQQLRHLSFLARPRQAALAEKHGLDARQAASFDYRSRSILDLMDARVQSQDDVVFLDEHYRSAPPIIAFSNARFYGDRLRVMTAKPTPPPVPPLVLHRVDGHRAASGVNAVEVKHVLDAVAALVAEDAGAPGRSVRSIGVLSPFRAQVDALGDALTARFEASVLDRHRVMVGTPFTFQGEERDVMLLSFALDTDSHSAAFRYLDRADVFNVAVTRARYQQHVITSLDPRQVAADSLLGAYLQHIAEASLTNSAVVTRTASLDRFAAEVVAGLEERGWTCRVGFPIAGLHLDLVVMDEAHACGIDLIGYPGAFEAQLAPDRIRMLGRATLPVLPLPYARWYLDPTACLNAVGDALRRAPTLAPHFIRETSDGSLDPRT